MMIKFDGYTAGLDRPVPVLSKFPLVFGGVNERNWLQGAEHEKKNE